MTAIEASSVRVSTLADGTLRLVVDIEPRHANAAFALFGAPGVPMALAALKPAEPTKDGDDHVRILKEIINPKRERMGPLCEWAVYRCQEPSFQLWCAGTGEYEAAGGVTEEQAREMILRICGVESRKELDTNREAASWFKARVMEPYAAWLKTQA